MNKKSNFLAVCLLEALEDENYNFSADLIVKHNTNPSTIVVGRGIAPLHYACGMENVEFAKKIVPLMLENGGDPNVKSDDNMTPMHVAALWGRKNIFKLLLEKGGDLTLQDDERKTPILYAIYECHYDIIKVIQNYLYEEKLAKKRKNLLLRYDARDNPNLTVLKNLEEPAFTPNKTNYNFDTTSPYFINVTQRKKDVLVNDNNLFELTEQNLQHFSKEMSLADQQLSFINSWREKVQKSKSRQSIIRKFNDIDELLSGIIDDESINFKNSIIQLSDEETKTKIVETANASYNFGKLLDDLKQKNYTISESFVTANDEPLSESNFIKSPRDDDYVVQMVEGYVHTDDENGLVFYEKRFVTNPRMALSEVETSRTSKSTDITIPDYDTEALRAELTNFGEPPGPITKSTKRLYTKRLTKIKRKLSKAPAPLINVVQHDSNPKFSVELENTIRNKTSFQKISDYMKLESEMSHEFQKSSNEQKKKWREGHLKTSFIYLLIDPRISENLPARSIDMEKDDIWKIFLQSVFYVGKGKSSRPYAHLYDAMKIYNEVQLKENMPLNSENERKVKSCRKNLLAAYNKQTNDSKKLERIMNIWKSDMGVICLHAFHNIMPAEAYTREAAIIDCMGLQHLTNLKRGDYYGPAQAWTLRDRKRLGIALLYKAMHVFIAEGESQLMPSDLI